MPSLPIPALSFANPWLLAGLALAAVPIVIHLFFRRPHREVPWAATRFLLSATKKRAPRIRLEQWLLLALRVLLIVLVVLALARPNTGLPTNEDGRSTEDGSRQVVLVLDASYSMAHEARQTRCFDEAIEALVNVAESADAGDTFQLVRMSDVGERVVISEPSYQADVVANTLRNQQVSNGRAAPLAALRDVQALLANEDTTRSAEVVIASDFQQVDWQLAKPEAAELSRVIAEIGKRATISLFDASLGPAGNQVVTSLDFEGEVLRAGRPSRFSGTIAGYELASRQETRVDFYVDGVPSVTESLTLAPNQRTTVAFQDTLVEPGPHGLELRLPADGLSVDNSRYLAVEVVEALRILLVAGVSGPPPEQASTYYLERALAPGRPSSETGSKIGLSRAAVDSGFVPEVISATELARAPLHDYNAVVLANVGRITEREVDRLRTFAKNGGGVVIALGNQIRPDVYNRLVAMPPVIRHDGNDDEVRDISQGLLPVHFEEVVGDGEHPERAIPFSTAELDHPISRPFLGNPGTGLESDFVLAYLRTSFDPSSSVRVALQYSTGDAAILTAPLGNGRVVLLTTSVGLSWAGPWPQIGRSYLPLMHEMVRYAAASGVDRHQLRVGDDLVWTLPNRVAGLTATVTDPGGRTTELPMTVTATGTELRYRETTKPGVYEVTANAPESRRAMFAVNVDPQEGNLQPLSTEALQAVFPESRSMSEARSQPVTVPDPSSRRWPASRWLLALAMVALLAEQVMAWRFRRGLAVLAALAGLVAIYALWHSVAVPIAAGLLGGLIFLGIWWVWWYGRF